MILARRRGWVIAGTVTVTVAVAVLIVVVLVVVRRSDEAASGPWKVGSVHRVHLVTRPGCAHDWKVRDGDRVWQIVPDVPDSWYPGPVSGDIHLVDDRTARFTTDEVEVEMVLLEPGADDDCAGVG